MSLPLAAQLAAAGPRVVDLSGALALQPRSALVLAGVNDLGLGAFTEQVDRTTAARQELQDTTRHTRLVKGEHGEKGGDRRLLSRLCQYRVASGKRGGDLTGENGAREVPRRDCRKGAAAVDPLLYLPK